MSIFWATRKADSLIPSDSESAAIFSRLSFTALYKVEVKQPRNGGFHRLYWLLCQRMANALGADPDAVSDLLKIRTGHVITIKTKNGIEHFPRSISYAKMDNTQFREFFEKCVVVICEEFGMQRPDVLAAVEDLIMPTEGRG